MGREGGRGQPPAGRRARVALWGWGGAVAGRGWAGSVGVRVDSNKVEGFFCKKEKEKTWRQSF